MESVGENKKSLMQQVGSIGKKVKSKQTGERFSR